MQPLLARKRISPVNYSNQTYHIPQPPHSKHSGHPGMPYFHGTVSVYNKPDRRPDGLSGAWPDGRRSDSSRSGSNRTLPNGARAAVARRASLASPAAPLGTGTPETASAAGRQAWARLHRPGATAATYTAPGWASWADSGAGDESYRVTRLDLNNALFGKAGKCLCWMNQCMHACMYVCITIMDNPHGTWRLRME